MAVKAFLELSLVSLAERNLSKMIKKENFESPTIAERETILRYDDEDHAWHVYTNVPKHIRRLMPLLDKNQTIRKGFDPKDGRLTMIEGILGNQGYISMNKKRVMNEAERERARKNLEKYRLSRQKGENN